MPAIADLKWHAAAYLPFAFAAAASTFPSTITIAARPTRFFSLLQLGNQFGQRITCWAAGFEGARRSWRRRRFFWISKVIQKTKDCYSNYEDYHRAHVADDRSSRRTHTFNALCTHQDWVLRRSLRSSFIAETSAQLEQLLARGSSCVRTAR